MLDLKGASIDKVQGQCPFVLTSLLDDRVRVNATGLALPKLTGNLPNSTVDVSIGHIDIGGDLWPDILLEGVMRNILGKLMAQENIFGWIVA